MKLLLRTRLKEVLLLVTPSGDFLPVEGTLTGRTLRFDGFTLTAEPAAATVGLAPFVELGGGLVLLEKGAPFLALKKLGRFPLASLLELVKQLYGEELAENLFLEATLGPFGAKPDEEALKRAGAFFKKAGLFFTRVVGFKYRKERFYEKGELKVREGDRVYALWEHDNPADPSAVAVYHASGEKLGYVRRSYAPFLKELLKSKLFLEGRVTAVFEREQPDEQIFVVLKLKA
ncbi:MAG: hypothetical protein GXO03_03780 [Aquificae bacterium]|nr:hypothetical protein [Aquificota bacterium]